MKKTLTLLLIVIAFFAQAKEVSVSTAMTVGTNFLNVNVPRYFSVELDELWLDRTIYDDKGEPCMYVFNFDEGFIIVAAQDCARPVLAYSTEGQFPTSHVPAAMLFHLDCLTEQLHHGIEQRLEADADIAAQWESVISSGRIGDRDGVIVEPLVASLWNQDHPYNSYCPVDADGPGGHAYAGCTATAASMIMHYWRFPLVGQGSHSYHPYHYPTQSVNFGATKYDWDNMPNTLNGSNIVQQEAVALLQWHAGVALESNYGPDGTSAYPHDVPDVLTRYFRYSNDCFGDWYESWKKDSRDQWHNRCRANLDAAHPIQYGGWTADGSGHAFICDGYDSNGLFHFNFGWSGSGNGFFALDAIVAQGYNFSYSNHAIFNIYPNGTRYHVRASTYPTNAGNIFGVGSYEPGQQCSLKAVAMKNYQFLNWSIDGEVVSNDSIYSFPVDGNKQIVANFSRNPVQITLEAMPANGGTVEGSGIYPHGDTVTITATPNPGYKFVKWKKNGAVVSKKQTYSFVASINTKYIAYFESLDDIVENQTAEVEIFPNPINDRLNIKGANGMKISIFNALGQVVYEINSNNDVITIETNRFDNGVYFVKVGDTTSKIVKF